ncbi:MAG: type I-E CRISPR-associated protein Cse2/CasB [Clostridia bacterium]
MANIANLTSEYVAKQIGWLCHAQHASAAALAKLRRGIGRAPGEMPELWEATLQGLPEELLSKNGQPTRGEWASYTALTLFALHQQGKDMQSDLMSQSGVGLGKAIRKLVRSKDDEERVKRRFDACATSADIVELSNHLRGMVQLLKAAGIALDYPALAKDLYLYQFPPYQSSVRLRWGQDYYLFEKAEEPTV